VNAEGRPEAPAEIEPDAEYRGFLFADLRGYTAFVEHAGDRAAADLLDDYRAMVRAEVERHAGAEIRTEGDSLYVVFRSARRAVGCALAIVAAAERQRDEHPERPIRVGIGVNAGETTLREEGYVGTAVNLAARVCAQAREGEVLVTSAVRDAIGGGTDVRFDARGTRRLKGIARPVELFSVRSGVASPAAPIRRPGSGTVFLIGGAALAAVLLVAFLVRTGAEGDGLGGAADTPSASAGLPSPSSSASAVASPTVDPVAYPTDAERELLGILGEAIASHCDRADEDVVPRFLWDADTAQVFGIPRNAPMLVDAGISCSIPSIEAPDRIDLWQARATFDFDSIEVPEAFILNRAGRLGLPRAECGGSTAEGYARWQLGSLEGWLLCHDEFGDAIIEWSYEGQPLFAVARRRDGDLGSLLTWWREEARLIAP
jgi:class 3 adenylate cyclase